MPPVLLTCQRGIHVIIFSDVLMIVVVPGDRRGVGSGRAERRRGGFHGRRLGFQKLQQLAGAPSELAVGAVQKLQDAAQRLGQESLGVAVVLKIDGPGRRRPH